MIEQELFDRVYRHLMQQGIRSLRLTPRGLLVPAYYGELGRTCPVGCLIPIDQRDAIHETWSPERMAARCSALQGVNLSLLLGLMVCHDTLTPPRWKKRLEILAREYGLQVSPALEALPLHEGASAWPQEYWP